MKLIFAKHIGFCKGVNRCIFLVEQEINKQNKVYALGELLHNKEEMKRLESLGLKVITDIKELVSLKNISLIIRTHGVEKKVLQQLVSNNEIKVIDGTCPIVKKNQVVVEEYSKKGYNVIIYGDPVHPEIKALISYVSPERKKFVVTSLEDIQKIDINTDEPVVVISQTTKSIEEYKKICDVLKTKFKNIKILNTICRETILREKEVEDMSKRVNKVIIIGCKNSANTQKLVFIAKKYKNNVYTISCEEEIKDLKFKENETIGIFSGASTPKWLIQKIVEKIC
jgi:4-hydroxy-3-methylbut-2-enyl diphosphate reductase